MTEKSIVAAGRINKPATFIGPPSSYNRSLFKKEVTIRAYKTSYGKSEYLIEADGERAWVRESSLVFHEDNNPTAPTTENSK